MLQTLATNVGDAACLTIMVSDNDGPFAKIITEAAHFRRITVNIYMIYSNIIHNIIYSTQAFWSI